MPHGKPGGLKEGAGAGDSSGCCTGDLRASAPSLLGVTGEKAEGCGRDVSSSLSLFSLSVTVFDFVALWLSFSIGPSHPTSTSSVSSMPSSLFSSVSCFSGLF